MDSKWNEHHKSLKLKVARILIASSKESKQNFLQATKKQIPSEVYLTLP
jgi:hypothetical protein